MRLSKSFFARPTCEVARELVGCRLVHEHEDGRLAGIIVETEAYTQGDPACHGWHVVDRETGELNREARGYGLFKPPGTSYVYLIYGMYWLLNVVTEPEGVGGGVLIRAVRPEEGLESMYARRVAARRDVDLANGPGKVAQAFDVCERLHGQALLEPPVYFEHRPEGGDPLSITTSSRIGITKAVERQWRYFLKDSPYVSPGTPSDLKRK